MGTDTQINETQETDDIEEMDEIDSLSDEEFLKQYNAGKFNTSDTTEEEPTVDEDAEEPSEEIDETSDEEDVESEEVEDDKEDEATVTGQSKEEPESSTEPSDTVDYKDAYSKIFKPFKANGKEITVENADDVISLMQMGANYVQKMTVMKEYMKTAKTLESAGIVSSEDINYLIDLKNKNPEAIKKLLQDSGIDPIDLDMSKVEYNPSNHSISDSDLIFSETIDDLKKTPHFETTSKIISSVWDNASKQALLKDPALIKKLNEEVEIGRYEKVQKIIDRERTFGRLQGVSDLEAYIQIVSNMVNASTDNTPTKTVKPAPTINNNKKSAALNTSKTPVKVRKQLSKEDILSMDDETFLRLGKYTNS